MKWKSLLAAAALAASLAAPPVSAELVLASGVNTGVTTLFDVSVDTTLNQVTVAIDNTQAGPEGVTGTLMSFGFNLPPSVSGASGSLIAQSWTLLAAGHDEPDDWAVTSPYSLSGSGGAFVQDFGAYGGSNVNGGNPARGVKFGEKATFTFAFADIVSADDFLGLNGLSARWQQVTAGEGSDKGWGNEVPPLTPVPEASTYGLAASALLAATVIVRRRRSSPTVQVTGC